MCDSPVVTWDQVSWLTVHRWLQEGGVLQLERAYPLCQESTWEKRVVYLTCDGHTPTLFSYRHITSCHCDTGSVHTSAEAPEQELPDWTCLGIQTAEPPAKITQITQISQLIQSYFSFMSFQLYWSQVIQVSCELEQGVNYWPADNLLSHHLIFLALYLCSSLNWWRWNLNMSNFHSFQ